MIEEQRLKAEVAALRCHIATLENAHRQEVNGWRKLFVVYDDRKYREAFISLARNLLEYGRLADVISTRRWNYKLSNAVDLIPLIEEHRMADEGLDPWVSGNTAPIDDVILAVWDAAAKARRKRVAALKRKRR